MSMRAFGKKWKIWVTVGLALAALAALAVWALWTGLVTRTYTVETAKLAQPVRLLLLTDLHSTIHGRDQSDLIRLVRELAPDAILLAGDIADDEVPHRGTELLLEAVAGEYPCFYVTGNHEFWAEDTEEILDLFRRYGVTVLAGTWSDLTVRGQTVRVFGVGILCRSFLPFLPGNWRCRTACPARRCVPPCGCRSPLNTCLRKGYMLLRPSAHSSDHNLFQPAETHEPH